MCDNASHMLTNDTHINGDRYNQYGSVGGVEGTYPRTGSSTPSPSNCLCWAVPLFTPSRVSVHVLSSVCICCQIAQNEAFVLGWSGVWTQGAGFSRASGCGWVCREVPAIH